MIHNIGIRRKAAQTPEIERKIVDSRARIFPRISRSQPAPTRPKLRNLLNTSDSSDYDSDSQIIFPVKRGSGSMGQIDGFDGETEAFVSDTTSTESTQNCSLPLSQNCSLFAAGIIEISSTDEFDSPILLNRTQRKYKMTQSELEQRRSQIFY